MQHNTMAPPRRGQQHGISLIVVMVMLLLGSILAIGASRTNWLNESLVSNESDYQRAYAAAEALLADAEADVLGELAGGVDCAQQYGNPDDFDGCRDRYGTNQPFIPETKDELDELETKIGANFATLPCRRGICLVRAENALGANWWNTNIAAMSAGTRGNANAIAATYGEHTGANPAGAGVALLGPRDGVYQAWYWIEVMPFALESCALTPCAQNLPIPSDRQPFFYRITAVVNGLKPGTRVVLRSIFVPDTNPREA